MGPLTVLVGGMVQGCEKAPARASGTRAPRVSYRSMDAGTALAEPGTLAVFGFGAAPGPMDDPRWLSLALEPFDAPNLLECWEVDDEVTHGRDQAVRWSRGGGWLFAASASGSSSRRTIGQSSAPRPRLDRARRAGTGCMIDRSGSGPEEQEIIRCA